MTTLSPSLIVNIPVLEPAALAAAAQLLPLAATTGAALTLTPVTDYYAASYISGNSDQPIAVVGATTAECLQQIIDRLLLTPEDVEDE